MVTQLLEAGGERVAVYGIENHQGRPVYVHAKVCVIDDWWATIGSDNFNRRSWTHDSELSAVVVDAAGGDHSAYARRLRLALAAEHLDRRLGPEDYPGDISLLASGRAPGPVGTPAGPDGQVDLDGPVDDDDLLALMADCVDPAAMFRAYADTAAALQAWHDQGLPAGERPPGRLRALQRIRLTPLTRAWATPVYRRLHDPDGRPRALRRRRSY